MIRTLALLLSILSGTAHTAAAFQVSAASCNDSARFYFERSRTDVATKWVTRALESSPSEADAAWSHVILGMIKEEEGYLEEGLKNYKAGRGQSHGSAKTMAAALNGIASIYTTTGEYDSIISFLERSRSLDTTAYNLTKNYQIEARYWQTQNEYDKALSALQLAQNSAEKLTDKRNLAIVISNTGGIHFSHDPDQNTARSFYNRSIAICDSSVHANILARNYGRLANSYMVSKDLANAESYLTRALKITAVSGNLPVRSYILSSTATLLYEQGKYREAVIVMEEPIRIRRELGQLRQLQNDLINIAEAYMMIQEYGKAQKALDEGMKIGKSLKDIVYLKYFYERASMLDSITGNYRGAYSNLKRATVYKDSTFSVQHLRDVKEVQEKYEAEQKEKIIAEKELEIEQQKYRQAVIIGTSVIAVLVLIVVLIVIRTRSRNKLLREREHQNHLRLQTIVKTQEEVQQRIARDLHDGLVQVLGAAKMSLQSVGPESEKALLQKHIRNASDIMDEAVTEARSISHQILPYSLLRDGLVSALEELFARSLSSFEFHHNDAKITIDEQTSINIYRIAQELVNNVQKHAESAHVSVSMKVTAGELKFILSDNGKGYNTNRATSGAGLSNMATRAGLLGGSIEVNSVIGKGTTTELIIPL
jgi:signal transduction histidine kinase